MKSKTSLIPTLPVILGIVSLSFLSPASLLAQTRSLTWTETVRLEVPGALGVILRATGAMPPAETRGALHLQGRTLIQEDDNWVSVLDLDNNRWLSVDHDAQTYMVMTFDEMTRVTEQALESVTSAASGVSDPDTEAARQELERSMEEAQAELDFRVTSEATGVRQRIGDHEATQHFITTEFVATAVPEGVDEREGGTMTFVGELWQSDGVPSGDALYEEWARQLASDPAFQSRLSGISASSDDATEAMAESLSGWNSQVGAGILRMSEAISELNGTTVRSTITAALVPLGATLDRAELIAWEPASMGDQLRAGAVDAGRQAAADAVRGAIGSLGGRFGFGGGRAEPEPEPAAEAPTAQPLFRIITSRENIGYAESAQDVLGALETQMADYREESFAMPQ